ncbi:MAG TPA: hypothetical protein VHP37_11755 [Burkholderiales bacterium]|nr:hypothetical protein [Burkholderiales bacterium]
MGLDAIGTQFVLYARSLGVDFTGTATIGRQRFYVTSRELGASLTKFGFECSDSSADAILKRDEGYADGLFRMLGAEEIHSFDHSGYEGATHIHDLNEPLPQHLKRQYSVVVDGGSLEHVFDFPTAIRNCMEMIRVGGHYLGIAPANNFMGHGFYQFSPELLCSVFAGSNGFELTHLVAAEVRARPRWYLVNNPLLSGGRVTLTNSTPVYLLTIARRIADVEPLSHPPQQSDFAAAWRRHATQTDERDTRTGASGNTGAFMSMARRHTPSVMKRLVRSIVERVRQARVRLRARRYSGFDPEFFQPFDPVASARKR